MLFCKKNLPCTSFAFIFIVENRKMWRFSGSIIIKKLESLKPILFLSQIEARIVELEEALKAKQFAVKKNPSGLVRIVRRGKSLLFYKRSSPSDAQGTYMPRSQEKLARALIQNDYDKRKKFWS